MGLPSGRPISPLDFGIHPFKEEKLQGEAQSLKDLPPFTFKSYTFGLKTSMLPRPATFLGKQQHSLRVFEVSLFDTSSGGRHCLKLPGCPADKLHGITATAFPARRLSLYLEKGLDILPRCCR